MPPQFKHSAVANHISNILSRLHNWPRDVLIGTLSWESLDRISASSTALFVKLRGGAAHGTANGKKKPRTFAISTLAYDGIVVANCTHGNATSISKVM